MLNEMTDAISGFENYCKGMAGWYVSAFSNTVELLTLLVQIIDILLYLEIFLSSLCSIHFHCLTDWCLNFLILKYDNLAQ